MVELNDEVPYWKQQQLEAEAKRAFALKHPLLGKVVKRMGEYGVIVIAPEPDELEQEYYIRFDNKKKNDMEGLWGLPFEEAPNYVLKYINLDGTLK